MKKLLFSLAFSVGFLSATPAMAAIPAFSTSQMAQVKLTDLSFKEVMRKFYSGQMNPVSINDEDIETMPNVGLGRANSDGETTVALMHPVIPYKNAVGESRYLVTIEKVEVFNGSVVGCHACQATADMYSFKKLDKGLFQLVSRTPKDVKPSGVNGRVMLDEKDVIDNMQPLGKNLIGSVFKNGSLYHGLFAQWWEALHLSENDFINIYAVGDGGLDNGQYDEDSPLHYSYEGSLKVMSGDSRYYPIILTYKGEMPNESNGKIESINYSKIVKFDSIEKIYK